MNDLMDIITAAANTTHEGLKSCYFIKKRKVRQGLFK